MTPDLIAREDDWHDQAEAQPVKLYLGFSLVLLLLAGDGGQLPGGPCVGLRSTSDQAIKAGEHIAFLLRKKKATICIGSTSFAKRLFPGKPGPALPWRPIPTNAPWGASWLVEKSRTALGRRPPLDWASSWSEIKEPHALLHQSAQQDLRRPGGQNHPGLAAGNVGQAWMNIAVGRLGGWSIPS